jgi:hypothetical protein
MNGLVVILLVSAFCCPSTVFAQGENPNPPDKPVKLVFIHHSTGENWLRDGYGNLGKTLNANNYFVSDTNYGWGPNAIGDRTDIVNWLEWFGPQRSEAALQALYSESGQNSGEITRTLSDPSGENQIIIFKSCFPNSALEGNPTDGAAAGGDALTVSNAKYIYKTILEYFKSRPDKMFVLVTAPPLSDATYATNARAFNTWLMTEWLQGYAGSNVYVFDFYNVLTGSGNHHRYQSGRIEWITDKGKNTSAYASAADDDHPNAAGSQKATDEFLPLLNIWYHRWQAGAATAPNAQAPASTGTAAAQSSEPTQEEVPTDLPISSAPGLPSTGDITAKITTLEDFEIAEMDYSANEDGQGSKIKCVLDKKTRNQGKNSLRMDYALVPQGYANCSKGYETSQVWSSAQGLTFYVHASQENMEIDFQIYANERPYEASYFTDKASVKGWVKTSYSWSQFVRPQWDADQPGDIILNPEKVSSLVINIYSDKKVSGKIWIDDIALMGVTSNPSTTQPPAIQTLPPDNPLPTMIVEEQPTEAGNESLLDATPPVEQPTAQPKEKKSGLPFPCPCSSLFLPMALVFFIGWRKMM